MIRKQLSEEGFDAGPLTIQYHLRQRHGTAPGRSTIHRALVRRGFVIPQPQKRPRTVLATLRGATCPTRPGRPT